ncbi:hypothetical protein [Anaerolentibacter hominis]|uniref:hypothetical protein n=1 Tax=Anaerolentibacter hominis TaxID=3079009 RepID=UPI0031B82613
MKTRICPVCDQPVKGRYCRNCHKFVDPVELDAHIHLNEQCTPDNYFEIQLENDKIRQEERQKSLSQKAQAAGPQTGNHNPDPVYTYQPGPSGHPYANSPQRNTVYTGGMPGTPKKKKTNPIVVIIVILVLIQFLIPIIIGITSSIKKESMEINAPVTGLDETEEKLWGDEAEEDPWSDDASEWDYVDLDYDEILELGEAGTGTGHIRADGAGLAAKMDKALGKMDFTCEMSTEMDNYKSVKKTGEEGFTFFYNYADWWISDTEYVTVARDSVTDELIYVMISLEDKEQADELLKMVLAYTEDVSEQKAGNLIEYDYDYEAAGPDGEYIELENSYLSRYYMDGVHRYYIGPN